MTKEYAKALFERFTLKWTTEDMALQLNQHQTHDFFVELAEELHRACAIDADAADDILAKLAEEISTLRSALGRARPFVAFVEQNQYGEMGRRASLAIHAIDAALILTDPDPEVQKILKRP